MESTNHQHERLFDNWDFQESWKNLRETGKETKQESGRLSSIREFFIIINLILILNEYDDLKSFSKNFKLSEHQECQQE